MLLNDARTYQIIFLLLFLGLGFGTRDWTLQPAMVGLAIATCLTTQAIAVIIHSRCEPPQTAPQTVLQTVSQRIMTALPSALITSLGLSLLLRTDHYSTMILASVVGISSKFVLRVQNHHIFNPANIGIITALLFTDAWVSPGQWGEEGWYGLLFLTTGGLVLQRVGRWDTTVAFLGTYAGLEAIRNVWLGWSWDVWSHRLMSGSLLLFALFMITDPRTIPQHRTARILWAMAIALLSFILRNFFFMADAIFWALFFMSPTTLLLNYLFSANQFEWVTSVPSADESNLVIVGK